jgi:tetratricopeptide (TPR) repeat protein
MTIVYHIFELLIARDSLDRAEYEFKKITPQLPNFWWWGYAISHQFYDRDVLARVYAKQGELDKAIDEYKRLLQFKPQAEEYLLMNPKLHYHMAGLYEQTHQFTKAIAEYQKFLTVWENANPDRPELIDARQRLAKLTNCPKINQAEKLPKKITQLR